MDEKKRKRLKIEALEFAEQTRRDFLTKFAGTALAGGLVGSVSTNEIAYAQSGRRVRIGIPLTYGEFNQP